jgi:lysophospholipase L1-like esterase
MNKYLKLKMNACFIILATLTSFVVMQNERPTLYIIGDSTVRNTNRPQCGWADKIADFFDTTQLRVSNQAMAGRSTRTFIKEKRWDRVMSTLKKGDYVIMQFGHNEGSRPDTNRAGYRGVLKGIGEETVELTWPDSTKELVHTYGWYLQKFVKDVQSKGAIPVIASMIPRNQFVEARPDDPVGREKVKRAGNDYGKWAKEVAIREGAIFIDLNSITADKYDVLGPGKVKELFSGDHTHTNEAGATMNAASVIEGIRSIPGLGLNKYLLQKNK